MFAVPMKITPTKLLNKATPKRITLTPVPAISNPANQVTVQQVKSTAPDTAKNTAFMPAQKQVNVGSSPVNAMENQITPRRVPLMPAINSQPKKNNTCGQVTPRRVPLTPVDTATPSSTSSMSANGLKQGKNTLENKDSARSVPQVSTSSSGDSGAENKTIQRQTSSGSAPRRIKTKQRCPLLLKDQLLRGRHQKSIQSPVKQYGSLAKKQNHNVPSNLHLTRPSTALSREGYH